MRRLGPSHADTRMLSLSYVSLWQLTIVSARLNSSQKSCDAVTPSMSCLAYVCEPAYKDTGLGNLKLLSNSAIRPYNVKCAKTTSTRNPGSKESRLHTGRDNWLVCI